MYYGIVSERLKKYLRLADDFLSVDPEAIIIAGDLYIKLKDFLRMF
jgi:hypothetical protein